MLWPGFTPHHPWLFSDYFAFLALRHVFIAKELIKVASSQLPLTFICGECLRQTHLWTKESQGGTPYGVWFCTSELLVYDRFPPNAIWLISQVIRECEMEGCVYQVVWRCSETGWVEAFAKLACKM